MESLKFGEIFRYKEKEYIFLAKTEDSIYAGQILNREHTEQIKNLYEKKSKQEEDCINRPLFCYVILQTQEFQDRMAHFGKPEQNDSDFNFDRINIVLNEEDLKEIKKEIERPKSPVPIKLKELIKDIHI